MPDGALFITAGDALKFDSGTNGAYTYIATLSETIPLAGASVSFDFGLGRTATGLGHTKDFQLIGFDSLGNQAFNINAWAENPNVGMTPSGQGLRWEATTGGSTVLLAGGNVIDLPGAADAVGDISAPSGFGNMTISLSATGYTLNWVRGATIGWTTDEIAFNEAAIDLTSISFNQRVTGNSGHNIDNIVVTAIPEPSSSVLLLGGLGGLCLLRRRK